jgi:methionyl-tRNA formyltransferase
MVPDHAQRHGIPVHTGLVKSDSFYQLYENLWRPDICIAATFGQRIDARLFGFPRHGFFNAHPCIGDDWPSKYAGPNPFQALIDDGHDHTTVALHRVDDGFDTGELINMSPRIGIPPGAGVVDMHKVSSPVVAKFVVPCLARLAGVLHPEAAGNA